MRSSHMQPEGQIIHRDASTSQSKPETNYCVSFNLKDKAKTSKNPRELCFTNSSDPNLKFNVASPSQDAEKTKKQLVKLIESHLSRPESPWYEDFIAKNRQSSYENFKPENKEVSTAGESIPSPSAPGTIMVDRFLNTDIVAELANNPAYVAKLQKFIETCQLKELSIVTTKLRQNLLNLSVIKSGSYIIQKAINRCPIFLKEVTTFSHQNFQFMASRDFSCRILRVLLRGSEDFRLIVTNYLRNQLDFCLDNFSSIFLLTESIRLSSNPSEFDFIVQALDSQPQQLLANRYFKRILVTFVEYCSIKQAKMVIRNLNLKKNFRRYLNDKFGCHILLILMQRNMIACLKVHEEQLAYYPLQMVTTKYYPFVILKLLETAPVEVIQQLGRHFYSTVLSFGTGNLPDKYEAFYFKLFYLYCAIKSWRTEDHFEQASYFKRITKEVFCQ